MQIQRVQNPALFIPKSNVPLSLMASNKAYQPASQTTAFSCACCAPVAAGLSAWGIGFLGTFIVGTTCVVASAWETFKNHAQTLFKPFIK